jgi:DNA primase
MNSTNNEIFDLERLKAISIVEVARQLGHKVWPNGVNYKMVCPWHDDHNPSLGLVTATGKNFCYCYTCGKGGSGIDLAMQAEGWSFQEACQWLSSTFGISTTMVQGYIPQPKAKPVVREDVQNYSYIPIEMVDELVTVENSLCQWLMKMFLPEAVEWACEEYRIG